MIAWQSANQLTKRAERIAEQNCRLQSQRRAHDKSKNKNAKCDFAILPSNRNDWRPKCQNDHQRAEAETHQDPPPDMLAKSLNARRNARTSSADIGISTKSAAMRSCVINAELAFSSWERLSITRSILCTKSYPARMHFSVGPLNVLRRLNRAASGPTSRRKSSSE